MHETWIQVSRRPKHHVRSSISEQRFKNFLASDDSSYVNAVELMVDGGATGASFGAPINNRTAKARSRRPRRLPRGPSAPMSCAGSIAVNRSRTPAPAQAPESNEAAF